MSVKKFGDPKCTACHGSWGEGECSWCYCDHGVLTKDDCVACRTGNELTPEQEKVIEAAEREDNKRLQAQWEDTVEEKRKQMSEDEGREVSSEEAADQLQSEHERYMEDRAER